MLQPKKLKYRKAQKGRSLDRKIATKGNILVHGDLGLKSLESKYLTNRQLEAAINELKKKLKKKGRFWLRVFPSIPRTKKPPETRMGGGKGDVDFYAAFVKPGTIILEVGGSDKNLLKEALKSVSHKLPLKLKIVLK